MDRSASLAEQRVAILGMGLMGGSLALALRGRMAAVYGCDPDPQVCSMATQRQIVDRCVQDPAEILPQVGMVILAAPVRAILQIINELPDIQPAGSVVLDLGSTKAQICAAMSALPAPFEAVGGHPICGKEHGTLVNAQADLYLNAAFVLTELSNTTERARRLVLELLKQVGAYPIWLDDEAHDRWVASTSHLPYLAANALAAITPREATPLIGPGFRSTARLAASPRRMMLDILVSNKSNILPNLSLYRRQLETLEQLLEQGEEAALLELLEQGAGRYESLLTVDSSADAGRAG
jgi:prephenate dehydrogenase